MHKFTKFLLVVLLALLIVYFWLSNFSKDYFNMANQVGARVGGGELTVSEYYTLVQCIETYKDYLNKKDYNTAYNMLGSSYRDFMSYEDYEKKISNVNIEDMIVKDIDIVTRTTFDMLVGKSGEEEHYSIIVDNKDNTFRLYPESFLDYKKIEMKDSEKSLKCTIVDYIVNIDKTTFNFKIENTSKKETITISKATLFTNMDQTITNSNAITVQPGEIKDVTIEFTTDYTFPNEVTLEREIEGKEPITYSFEIN